MNALNNSVRLLGNVGMDPQVITFDNGNKLAKFSLATSDRKKDPNHPGQFIDDTQWHQLIIWGKGADIIETYVKKGAKLAVDGKITYRHYIDKNENKRFVTEITVANFSMLGPIKEKSIAPTAKTRKKKADLPF